MVPHIDSITPDHGQPNDEILIQGSGFRPNDTYVRAVMFRSARGSLHAEFSHVVGDDGVIRDDQLIARIPPFLPGAVRVWVENIEIVPPAPGSPKPGELEPDFPPEPQYHLYPSNKVPFLIDCIQGTRVTEATMPDVVRDAVEDDLLEIQELFGGKFPVEVSNFSEEDYCWGNRTKDLKVTLRFDTIETSWTNNDLWTITVRATIRATAKIDIKSPATACQWVRWPDDMDAGGGGHRWKFTVAVCSRECTATTVLPPFQLFHVSSVFNLGTFAFEGVPNDMEGDSRDHVEDVIRATTLGPSSPLLSLFEIFAEKAYRLHVGGDCPPLEAADICAAVEALQTAADGNSVMQPLRAFRTAVLESSPSGRVLSRLWSVLSPDLVRVIRRDPVVWGEAVHLLREFSRAVDEGVPGRRVVLTRARYERLRKLFERSRPRLSPVTGAAGEVVLAGLDRFVGVSAGEIPGVLGRWRLPAVVTRVVDRLGTLTARRVRRGPPSRTRRKRGR